MVYSKSMSGDFVAYDLASGEARVVATRELLGESSVPFDSVSGGGRFIALRGECGGRIIRLSDGADVTPIENLNYARWDPRSTTDRFALLMQDNRTVWRGTRLEISDSMYLWDLVTGETILLGKSLASAIAVTSKDEVIVSHASRIYHWKPGMSEPRIIYEPRD